ncbi:MAG: SUF system NifU family Fe-S cluster assembly protein [Methanomethylophilus sp.]|nr:SUF system NifU family Fe-S cluster assembly protein [Methanomethylophilus sp.]
MPTDTFYGEILTDHNLHPGNKRRIEGPTAELEGVNPSCGDDIVLQLKVGQDGKIEDAAFSGSGCAVSQASADMMCDLVISRTEEDALRLADIFMRMIKGEADSDEISELGEAGCLADVSHMPARVKCAMLGWRTLRQALGGE